MCILIVYQHPVSQSKVYRVVYHLFFDNKLLPNMYPP